MSSVVEDYDSSENAAIVRARHTQPSVTPQSSAGHNTDDIPPPPPLATPNKSLAVPKLNLGGLGTLSPPPTEAQVAQQALAGSLSARGGPPNSASSNASSSRSNSVSFYQAPPVPVPAVIGAMTTPRTERSDTASRTGPLASGSIDAVTPMQGHGLTGGADDFLSDLQHQEAAELRQEVLQAAAQTAQAMQANRDDYEARRLMVRNCQKLNETHLRKLLTFDPRLAMARCTEMGNLAVDGQTPLHVAASFGNVPALQIMVEKGEGVSLWVRDLQGRTPLHIAAEKGQQEACAYLREAMTTERQRDPIGEHAPTDLAVCILLSVSAWVVPAVFHDTWRVGHNFSGCARRCNAACCISCVLQPTDTMCRVQPRWGGRRSAPKASPRRET
jgi:hypothetical protein